MIILGVDPGTLFTGYAVINGVDEPLSVLKYDVIKIPSANKFPIRLKQIYDKLVEVIKMYKPEKPGTGQLSRLLKALDESPKPKVFTSVCSSTLTEILKKHGYKGEIRMFDGEPSPCFVKGSKSGKK